VTITIQDGKDRQEILYLRSFSAREPLIIRLFYGKCPIQIRHHMGVGHTVVT